MVHQSGLIKLSPQQNSDLYYSTLFLPADKRHAVAIINAFQQELNKVVYECSNVEIASQKLDWWANEIDRIFNGVPQHPIGKNLAQIVQQFNLQRIWFDEILHGTHMDLSFQGYQTMDDLLVYCHCVGSSIAMLRASVLGYTQPETLAYAKQLGLALQLITVIRNMGFAARCGRIYIPETTLGEFDLRPQTILNLEETHKFTALMRHFTGVAKSHLVTAKQLLPDLDRAQQCSGLIMMQINLTILQEIERTDFAVLQQQIDITPLRKLWIAWRMCVAI